MEYLIVIPMGMMATIVFCTFFITRELLKRPQRPRPTYYVTHPDGSFTKANPQP